MPEENQEAKKNLVLFYGREGKNYLKNLKHLYGVARAGLEDAKPETPGPSGKAQENF